MTDDELDHACRALSIIERVLERKSAETEAQDAAEACRALVRMRDGLIEQVRSQRGGASARERLDQVNVLLSMMAAAEYPLSGIHWDRMAKTRDLLKEMTV